MASKDGKLCSLQLLPQRARKDDLTCGSSASQSLLRRPRHHLPDNLRLQMNLIDLRSLRLQSHDSICSGSKDSRVQSGQRLLGWAISTRHRCSQRNDHAYASL